MLSQGPFSYNRFDAMDALYQKVYESKKAKKDYDGDGKVESGSEEFLGSRDKAIKKAMGKSVKEADDKKDLPPFMKDKKDDKKKGCSDCEGDCKCDDKKEKGSLTKEDVINHLIDEGFANNPVSAEVLFTHMSDEWLLSIEEGFKPLPKEKMARQANKAYGQEQRSAAAGDAKGTNKQMQRRIAMTNPQGRKAQLMNKG